MPEQLLFMFLAAFSGGCLGGVLAGLISYRVFAHKRDSGWERKKN